MGELGRSGSIWRLPRLLNFSSFFCCFCFLLRFGVERPEEEEDEEERRETRPLSLSEAAAEEEATLCFHLFLLLLSDEAVEMTEDAQSDVDGAGVAEELLRKRVKRGLRKGYDKLKVIYPTNSF